MPSAVRGELGLVRRTPATSQLLGCKPRLGSRRLREPSAFAALRTSPAHMCARDCTRGCVQLAVDVGACCARVQMCV